MCVILYAIINRGLGRSIASGLGSTSRPVAVANLTVAQTASMFGFHFSGSTLVFRVRTISYIGKEIVWQYRLPVHMRIDLILHSNAVEISVSLCHSCKEL
jgi:hypothetical protein